MKHRSHGTRPLSAMCARLVALGGLATFSAAALAQEYFDPNGFLPSPWYVSGDWADFGALGSVRLPAVQILGGFVPPPDPDHSATTSFDVMAKVERQPGPPNFPNVPGVGTIFMHTVGPGPINMDTEMLQLDLAGGDLPAGMMIRESPTRASLGQASVRAVQGGFMVSSFFDVFFDLSLDGGGNWLPAVQSVRMTGVASPVPEPASLATLCLGAMALLRRRRRA